MSVLFTITTLTAVAEDLDNNRNSALVYSLLSEEGVFQEARPGEAASKRFSVDATSGDIIVSRQVSCDWWSRGRTILTSDWSRWRPSPPTS